MKINKSNLTDVNTTDILPRHDLVFKSPICDPTYGLPLGDGSTGYLLWLEENCLNININNTDLIDDIGEGDFYLKREDETHTVCRNGAKFTIDFGYPVFEGIYNSDFDGRLSLKNATATISSQTPFGKTSIKAFASEKAKTGIVTVETQSEERLPLRATLERWGSRTFMYWYIRYAPDNTIGLSGTSANITENISYISQEMGQLSFSVGILPVSHKQIQSKKFSSHKLEFEAEETKTHKIDFYISLATGITKEEAESTVATNLINALNKGKELLYTEHIENWKDFWNKSYVNLGKENDFAENLWYLNLYYGNCQMKGKYPPHFCNGVWGFNHDFVPWNLYFHYNTQHAFNSYNGANHPELMDTYFKFRKSQLPIAQKYAMEIKGTKGAFYTDISDMKGRMIADKKELSKNCTCGAQIAMLMYKNYLYTGDENFLKDTALPVMKAVGDFYLDMLKKGEDGLYHIYDTTAYEGSPLFNDSITDLVAIRSLFGALIKEVDENEIYIDRLSNLADFPCADILPEEMSDGHFVHGIGKGKPIQGTKVLAAGKLSDNNSEDIVASLGKDSIVRKTFGTAKKTEDSYYGFPDVEFSPIYPAGIVGIKDKGTHIYNMLYNSICMHHPALETETDDKKGMCMGWCMMPIYLARMGMADELSKQLKRSISTWIAYPQGFGLYGGYEGPDGKGANTKRSTRDRFIKMDILKLEGKYKEEVIDFKNDFFKDKPEYHSTMNLWKFRHFDYEALPIIANSITEMLIQSHEGYIRLFGAIPKNGEASFKLITQGGFEVNALYRDGECVVIIENTLGKELKIAFENIDKEIKFYDYDSNNIIQSTKENSIYTLKSSIGDKILALSEKGKDIYLETNIETNQKPKHLGDAVLGCVKEF